MPGYTFQLISPRGPEPFHQSLTDDLVAAMEARGIPLTALDFHERDSEEDLRRGRGYVAGLPVPVAVLVSVTVQGSSREEVRAALQLSVADVGRRDVEVVNA